MKVRCVHRHVHEYPLVTVIIKFNGQKYRVEAVVSPCLTNSWDKLVRVSGISEVHVCGWSCSSEAWGEPGTALAGQAIDINSGSGEHGGWGGRFPSTRCRDFPWGFPYGEVTRRNPETRFRSSESDKWLEKSSLMLCYPIHIFQMLTIGYIK